jgi:hypothetical protein
VIVAVPSAVLPSARGTHEATVLHHHWIQRKPTEDSGSEKTEGPGAEVIMCCSLQGHRILARPSRTVTAGGCASFFTASQYIATCTRESNQSQHHSTTASHKPTSQQNVLLQTELFYFRIHCKVGAQCSATIPNPPRTGLEHPNAQLQSPEKAWSTSRSHEHLARSFYHIGCYARTTYPEYPEGTLKLPSTYYVP